MPEANGVWTGLDVLQRDAPFHIHLVSPRRQPLVGELAHHLAHHLLLFAQGEVHAAPPLKNGHSSRA